MIHGNYDRAKGNTMLRPLLIIGVGGSGGKTIRSMIQAFERKFVSARYDGGIPKAWQFLQIDTTYDGKEFPAPMLDKDSFHQVLPPGDGFYEVLHSISNRGNTADQQKMLSGWGVANSSVNLGMGAGQVRAIGRQAGVADSVGTLKAINTAISKMLDPTGLAELSNLASALQMGQPIATPQALIFASVGGGTGAGIFIDVAELLKRASDDAWTKEAIAFLYTSEVFTNLNAGAKDVAKNALGAFNELIAGKWVGLSDRSEFLYQKLGLPPVAQADNYEFGCKGNILIGTRNKAGTDISIGNDGQGQNEVFLTVGEAIAGVLGDDVTSEWLFQVAFVNITQTKSAIDNSGMSPNSSKYPTLTAAGIGFGQLSLGADRVVDYVADALTRSQVQKLLWPEFDIDAKKEGSSTQSVIEEKANKLWPNFLIDSQLDEKGSQDQIINALFIDGWQNEVRAFAKNVSRTSVGEKPLPISDYTRRVFAEWNTEHPKFVKQLQDKIQVNAQKWVPKIQSHFQDHVARTLTNEGYSVTLKLVDRLKKELSDYSLAELIRESKEKSEAVFNPDQTAFLRFIQETSEGLTGVGSQNSQFLEKVGNELARSLAFRVISHVNSLGASLIQDILQNFFEPVIKSMVDARYDLHKEIVRSEKKDEKQTPFEKFPKWGKGEVSDVYKPRTIERILIDPSEYEAAYEMYAKIDSKGNPPFNVSITNALLGTKLNPQDGDPNPQRLIETKMPWTTGVREAQDGMGTPVGKVSWFFNTSLQLLGVRNRKWLKDRDSAFGKFTNIAIKDFLEAEGLDRSVQDDREQKFVKEFQAMLSLAQPLVLLNDNAMNYVKSVGSGGNASGMLLKSSKLPVDINSPLGKKCTNVLQNFGEDPADGSFEQNWFSPTSTSRSLYACSTTQASLPAWAFASLTDPILKQAAISKNNSQTWQQFWDGRRARPLSEAIPFETEMRKSIITGWFIASLFGLREIDGKINGFKAKVWNSTLQTPGWSNFPDPLLDTKKEDATRLWMLPAILTSAGLALCEFGATGNKDSINAYKFLLYLGREVTTTIPNRDQWSLPGAGDELPTGTREMCSLLRDWISEGKKPSDRELLNMVAVRLSPGDNRTEAIKGAVEELREQYKNAWETFKNMNWSQIPETWELKDDIDSALADIYNYVSGLHTVTAVTGA